MASISIHPLSYCTLTHTFSQQNATIQSKAAIPLKQFPKALSCEHTADVRGRSTATAPAGGATTAQDSRELNTTLPHSSSQAGFLPGDTRPFISTTIVLHPGKRLDKNNNGKQI